MSDHWRVFRVRGKLKYHDVFVILEIHHGGQFVEVGSGRFEYNGGEVHWVEGIDPDKFSWTDLNSFAWRLGYRKPPVHYWFKYHVKPKYLPIRTDKEAVGMLSDLPKARKVEVYYVGGGDRDVEVCEKEDQMKEFSEVVPHVSFMPEIVMVPLKTADMGNDKGKRRELDIEDSEDEEGTEHDDEIMLCHRDAFLLQVGRNASKVVEASRSKAVSSQSDASNSMQTSSQPSVQASSFQDGTTKGRKIWKY